EAEAGSGHPGALAVVEAVTTALGHLLVRHAGVERTRPLRVRGGLSGAARRRVLEMIDARLDARLTVEMLAREVGLSPAHFARAFKETMGRAPHQYLLWLRLERARRLLELCGTGCCAGWGPVAWGPSTSLSTFTSAASPPSRCSALHCVPTIPAPSSGFARRHCSWRRCATRAWPRSTTSTACPTAGTSSRWNTYRVTQWHSSWSATDPSRSRRPSGCCAPWRTR